MPYKMGAMATPQPTKSTIRSHTGDYSANTATSTTMTKKRHVDTAPATPPPAKSARRRVDSGRASATTNTQGPVEVIDLTGDNTSPKKPKKKTKEKTDVTEVTERRARVFRKQAPVSCLDRLDRARTQRLVDGVEKKPWPITECVSRQDVRGWPYNYVDGWLSGDGVRCGRHDGESLQSHGWEGASLQLSGRH